MNGPTFRRLLPRAVRTPPATPAPRTSGPQEHDPGELGALALGLLDPAAYARGRGAPGERARPAGATWRT